MTSVFVSLPEAARAMGLSGCGSGCCAAHQGGLLTGAAYAVVATLGYWVLLQAVKETSACVRRIGDVLGSVLVIVGLLGVLCSVTGHIRNSLGKRCGGPGPMVMAPGEPQGMGLLPPGHPPVGDEPAPAPKKAVKPR